MREKVMLIAGCSHTAGSEIDGQPDSIYNRQHSYGNLLAKRLGYRPINIAVCGFSNGAIARSVLEWFNDQYTDNMEVFVFIAWTESLRVDAPYEFPTWHQEIGGQCVDWFTSSSTDFLQINIHDNSHEGREKDAQDDYRKFVVNRGEYLEIVSANLILQLQYFFKYKNIKYLMANAGHQFSEENEKYLKVYLNNIDESNFINLRSNPKSFYHKYRVLGYTNPIAKYGHHGEEPHRLFSDILYNFLMEKQNDRQN
jgi:hypothetical protein